MHGMLVYVITVLWCGQAGAESKMRAVAKRIMNLASARALQLWKCNCSNEMEERERQARAEAVMKRAGKRMLNRGASDCVMEWAKQMREQKAQSRGEKIMRRAAARMQHGDMVAAVVNWHTNQRAGVVEMVSISC